MEKMEQNSKNFKGCLIAFEGIDGSGKTTLIKKLSQHLELKGFKVHLSEEPGDNPIGKAHRELSLMNDVDPYAAALISTADRYFKMNTLCVKINQGYIILSDRYYLSGLAYHLADGIPLEEYAQLNKNVLKPDLYIFLDVSLKNARKRIQKPHDRWETILEKVYHCYYNALEFITSIEKAHVKKLDANLSINDVVKYSLSAIIQCLGWIQDDQQHL